MLSCLKSFSANTSHAYTLQLPDGLLERSAEGLADFHDVIYNFGWCLSLCSSICFSEHISIGLPWLYSQNGTCYCV